MLFSYNNLTTRNPKVAGSNPADDLLFLAETERLEEAATAYRGALEEWTRERAPLDWAIAQNDLGTALKALGERESGTERLEEANAAYCAALEESTRDRVPLRWE